MNAKGVIANTKSAIQFLINDESKIGYSFKELELLVKKRCQNDILKFF